MPESSGEIIPPRHIETSGTLFKLNKLLENTPEVFGDKVNEVRETLEEAQRQLKNLGRLSYTMTDKLNELYRPLKPVRSVNPPEVEVAEED